MHSINRFSRFSGLIFLWLLLVPFFVFSSCKAENDLVTPGISRGILDLKNWNFAENGVLSLDGEWEFYWQRLLQPEDFNGRVPPKSGFIDNPTVWNGYSVEKKKLPGEGYATYRLTIKNCRAGSYGLKMGTMATSYKLWINEKLAASNGSVGTSRREMIPQQLPQIALFAADKGDIEILIQVANFYSDKGGIWSQIYFGPQKEIIKKREVSLALEIFIFGVIFIMSLYHFTLYIFRRKDVSSLYFALACFSLALRTIFTGEFFIVRMFPSFNWELQLKIEFLTFYTGFPVFMMFFWSLYRDEFSRLMLKFFQAVGIVFSLLVLVFPVRIYSFTIIPYHLVVVFGSLYLLTVIIKALLNKREGAVAIFGGLLVLVMAVINDMLDANNIINTGYLLPHALIFFIFSQSIILSKMFSTAFSEVEKLTAKLQVSHDRIEDYQHNLENKIRDRTRELAEANDKLKELDRAKTEFFANISHEFRTPLTLILSPVGEALRKNTGIAGEDLRYLQRNGEELLSLINDLLDISRLDAGYMHLEVQKTDPGDFLMSYCTGMESVAALKGISLRCTLPEESPEVWVDIERFDRIMANLFSNSFKFTDRGGSIDVALSYYEGKVILHFSDTGSGIPADKIDSIFKRFTQAETGSTRRFQGSGIGLAIIKEFVELHDGTVSVESRYIGDCPENHGTVFTIELPAGKEHYLGRDDVIFHDGSKKEREFPLVRGIGSENNETPEDSLPEGKETSPREIEHTIMIVEDNRDLLEFLGRLLGEEYEVYSAANGREALEILKTAEEVDLIVSDVMMPEMDGYELVKEVRREKDYAGIPVILLTAKASPEMKLEGLFMGATDYVTKPFNAEELKLRMKNQLEMKRLRDTMEQKNRRLYEKLRAMERVREVTVTDNAQEKLEQAIEFIRENYCEDLSREELAEAVDMNPDHFSRLFNRYTGKKLPDFINELRIEGAKRLLLETSQEITLIAYDSGFDSLRTFNRVFKKLNDVTPGEFRQSSPEFAENVR